MTDILADKNRHPNVLADAALILLSMSQEAGKEALKKLVEHDDLEIKSVALDLDTVKLESCMKNSQPKQRRKIVEHLMSLYRKGDEKAFELLMKFGDKSHLPVFESRFENETDPRRFSLFGAIARVKGEDARSFLLNGLKDERLRFAALKATGKIFSNTGDEEFLKAFSSLDESGFYDKAAIVKAAMEVSKNEIPPCGAKDTVCQGFPDLSNRQNHVDGKWLGR